MRCGDITLVRRSFGSPFSSWPFEALSSRSRRRRAGWADLEAGVPADAAVLQAETVRVWLEHQPHVLTPWQAYELVLIADQQATWA